MDWKHAPFILFAGLALSAAYSAGQDSTSVAGRRIILRERGAEATARLIGRIPRAAKLAVPVIGGHVLVLNEAGEVWAWGENAAGQLGTGNTRPVAGWVRVEGLGRAVAIAAGANHSVALSEDGTVWTWGDNAMGQLGDGTLVAHLEPRAVPGLTGVLSVGAGALFSAALREDGSVWVFGSNWEETAPGETQKMMMRPVRVKGLKIEGEIDVIGGRVVPRQPELQADLLSQVQTTRAEGSRTVVDARLGWTLAWIEAEPEESAVADRGLEERNGMTPARGGIYTSRGSADDSPRMALVNASKVAAGGYHTLAVAADNTVWAWGYNAYGQLGNGTTTDSSAPVQVSGLTGVIAVAGGYYHSLALKNDGTVWAWGWNDFGQLGDGTLILRTSPVQVTGLTGVTAVAAGVYHSLALKSDGTVWAWGGNSFGQLGDGTHTQRNAPVTVGGLINVTAVAAGGVHSLAVKNDFTVWAWGSNGNGQLGDATFTQRTSPVQVAGLTGAAGVSGGYWHSLAVKGDGTVLGWGYNFYGQLGDGTAVDRNAPVPVGGLTGVSAVTAGYWHSIALKTDGSVLAWGLNAYGQLGNGTTTNSATPVQASGLTGVVGVAGGYWHSAAVKNDGAAWAWGWNGYGQVGYGAVTIKATAGQVSGLTGVSSVAGGKFHNLSVKGDGTLWAWGNNDFGQVGDGTTTQKNTPVQVSGLTGVVAAAGGASHSLALKGDGTVWAWGWNGYGQLGDGTVTQRNTPVAVNGLTGVVAVAAGQNHSLALKGDGTVWAWGSNGFGQLGDTTITNRLAPVQVSGLTGVVSIAAGYSHSLAVRNDFTLRAWGLNSSGQLGDGTVTQRTTAVPVSGLTGVIATAGGSGHSLAVRSDHSVWAWGDNSSRQLGDGTTTQRNTPVKVTVVGGVSAAAAGLKHSLTLKDDSTVWAFGDNSEGQLGDGTATQRTSAVQVGGLTGATVVSAGDMHGIARQSDGTVWVWGWYGYGQMDNGAATYQTTPVPTTPLGSPDLALTMGHSGNFAVGMPGTYALSVANVSSTATSGTITVTDPLPPGLSYLSATGAGWACSAAASTVTCTNAGPINPGATSGITLTVNVGLNAYPGVSNTATVSNASDLNLSNNVAGDPVPVGGAGNLRFVAVRPCRVADTRLTTGPFGGPMMTVGSTRSFAIPQSACGIPASALAYSLNVHVVPRGALGYLTLWPAGQTQPLVSTLSSLGGQVKSNAAIIPAGTGGAVRVFVTNDTDVVLDISGYFDTSAGSSFYAATPCRVADTRLAAGPLGGPTMGTGETRDFPVPSSVCSLPATATAYSMNYTVVPPGYLSYLTTWPAGQSKPLVSTLSSWEGKIVANAAIVPAGTNGAVSVYAPNQTHIVLDTNGYFAAPGGTGELKFYPVTPCRAVDTRKPDGPLEGPMLSVGSTRSFEVPQSACSIPATAKAYALNVTVVPSGPLGYLTTWPAGGAQPLVSTLNALDGSITSNAAIVPAGANGAISIYVTNNTHVVLDINGYFQ